MHTNAHTHTLKPTATCAGDAKHNSAFVSLAWCARHARWTTAREPFLPRFFSDLPLPKDSEPRDLCSNHETICLGARESTCAGARTHARPRAVAARANNLTRHLKTPQLAPTAKVPTK